MADKIELDTGTELPSSFVLKNLKESLIRLKTPNLIYLLPEKQDVENLLCLNILDRIRKDPMPL